LLFPIYIIHIYLFFIQLNRVGGSD
jgi:hypothetical protein